ncbi:MAG TPA: acetate kinase [Tepiditoga sp.]|nr:acetate kinase [Tepiditoga sp.]
MKVLVVNSGSSSLKYQILDMETEKLLCKGLVERIGLSDSHIVQKCSGNVFEETLKLDDHEQAFKRVIELITHNEYGCLKSLEELHAVGHRLVHGGEKFSASTLITDEVLEEMEHLVNLAPLHNPANITGVKAARKLLKNIPQVGVFDTAFHQTMPAMAYMYGIPYQLYETHKIRRYGFHGTSHKYVSGQAAKLLNKNIKDLKIVSCHIGNGASVAAIDGGKVIDTSMGFTPLEGLMMGTRSGDLDPAIILYLIRTAGYTPDEVDTIINQRSGIFGVSNYLSFDMRDIRKARDEGNKLAGLALDMYIYRIAKYIGSYATAMKGLDAVIFTAGVGENTVEIRQRVSEYLTIFGAEISDEKNEAIYGVGGIFSKEGSKVKLLMIPTNEELAIARDTIEILKH